MMPMAFLRKPGRSMISSLVTAWTTGNPSIGARRTFSMLNDIATRASPEVSSTAVPVANGGPAPTRPIVRRHAPLSRGLHFADTQRVDPAGDDELTGSLEHFARLSVDPVHHFRAEHLHFAFGCRSEGAWLGVGRANEARDLERSVLPVDA